MTMRVVSSKNNISNLNQYLLRACKKVFGNLSTYISNKKYDYKGSETFTFKKLSEIFYYYFHECRRLRIK